MARFPSFIDAFKLNFFSNRAKIICSQCKLKDNCICPACGDYECKNKYPCSQIEEVTRCKKRP